MTSLEDAWSISGSGKRRRAVFADAVSSCVAGSLGEFGRAVVLEDVPEEFFFVAASSTGHHHPAFDLGDGGLVRHSLVVASMARHLARPYMLPDTDTVVLAGLLHDAWKSFASADGPWLEHTQSNHGTVGSVVLGRAAERLGFGGAGLVAECVRTHPSAWYDIGTPVHLLPTPEQQAVAAADYLASRESLAGWSLGD